MAKSKAQEKVTKRQVKPKTSKSLRLPINFIIVTVSMAVAIWFGYKGYLETRVNTPYNVEKLLHLDWMSQIDIGVPTDLVYILA